MGFFGMGLDVQRIVLIAALGVALWLPLDVAAAAEVPEKGHLMTHYLVEAKYSDQAWAAMAQSPQDRSELLRPVVESLGGKIDSFWFSFGDHDAVVVLELPDNVSAEALQIAGAAGGGFKVLRTTVLLTVAEAMEAMRKAGAVRSSAAYGKAHDALTR